MSEKYSSGHLECSFENPAEKFLPEGQNFYLNILKCQHIFILPEKILFLKVFLLKCWKQFSTFQWEKFTNRRNIIRSMSEHDKKYTSFSEKNIASKCSSGHVECSFGNSFENVLPEEEKNAAHCLNMMKNTQPSQKN